MPPLHTLEISSELLGHIEPSWFKLHLYLHSEQSVINRIAPRFKSSPPTCAFELSFQISFLWIVEYNESVPNSNKLNQGGRILKVGRILFVS